MELERDKFTLKKDVIKSQENTRTQIIETRLKNIEKRNGFSISLGLKVIEELGANKVALEEIYDQFRLIDEETEFLAVEGLQLPFEELLVDRKSPLPVPSSFSVTEDKFKKLNIGEDEDESED